MTSKNTASDLPRVAEISVVVSTYANLAAQFNSPPSLRKYQISLPSAADLFDSVDTSSASFMSAPAAPEDVPLTTPKRKKTDGDGSGSSSNKKSRESKGAAGAGGAAAGPNKGLIPPQMSRPNVVTEDSALWSSDASMKRQRKGEAERKGAAAAAAEGKGKKGGKDSLSFKQREKVSGKRWSWVIYSYLD